MANYRVISSDNHVFESPDLWTSRAKPAFKDRVPQLVREYDGDWWYCDGHRVIGLSPGAQTGMRFEAPEQMVRTTTFDRVRRGGYVPEEHLKDMDADGVDVSIVYPTVGLLLYSVPDSAFLSEIFRGYNDWLAEFSAAEPKRLQVAGAALAVGAAPSPGEDQAAKSFFEDLLRRGRLKIPRAGKGTAETLRAAAPQTHETHTHELRREGKHMVLRRVRIDCGFGHH